MENINLGVGKTAEIIILFDSNHFLRRLDSVISFVLKNWKVNLGLGKTRKLTKNVFLKTFVCALLGVDLIKTSVRCYNL